MKKTLNFFKKKPKEEAALPEAQEGNAVLEHADLLRPKKLSIRFFIYIDGTELDEGFDCGKNVESIIFDDEKYFICIQEKEAANFKKMNNKQLNEYKYIALYAVHNNYNHSFYAYGKEIVWCVSNYNGMIEITVMDTLGAYPEDVAEQFFMGGSLKQIDESLSTIQSTYLKSNKTRDILMGVAAIVIVGYVVVDIFSAKEEIIKTPPPKPPVVPLTQIEKAKISRALSLDVINGLEKYIQKFSKDGELIKVQRNIGFSMARGEDIAPVEPTLDEKQNVWVYPPGPRRGAIRYTTNRVTEQVFPGIGYIMSSEGLYTKDHRKEFQLDENYLNENMEDLDKLVFTKECLVDALHLDADVTPYKREDMDIDLSISKLKASVVLNDLKPLVEKCPIIVQEVNQEEDKFRITLTLFKAREPKEQAEELQ